MNLLILRDYELDHTDGEIFDEQGKHICFSMEPPNKDNKKGESCIPEGRYHFHKKFSQNLGWVYELERVENRSLIYFHAANVARQLRGCIAPGLKQGTLEYEGEELPAVLESKAAMDKLFTLCGTSAWVTIKERENDSCN